MRIGETYMDEKYFVRYRQEPRLKIDCFYLERASDFSTNFDFRVAEIITFDMLRQHIDTKLKELKFAGTE